MPAKGQVSLTWQTIFCFIPVMDIVASYRVERLRWYLLVFVIFGAISTGVQTVVNPLDDDATYDERIFSKEAGFDWNYAILGSNQELSLAIIAVHQGIAYVIAVYLIRRWSGNWNRKFDGTVRTL